jgi:hypothetical protein
MRIAEVPFELDRDEVTGGISGEFLKPQRRSSGLHLGEVLRDLENSVGKNKNKRPHRSMLSKGDQDVGFRYMEVGFIWEVLVEHVWKERRMLKDAGKLIRQGEIERDGIYMTPDALTVDDWVLQEYKATWRSSRRADPIEGIFDEFVTWGRQIKAYCAALGTEKASLMVLFVNGNWAPPVPQTRRFDIQFSQRELESNWQMLLQHRDRMAIGE